MQKDCVSPLIRGSQNEMANKATCYQSRISSTLQDNLSQKCDLVQPSGFKESDNDTTYLSVIAESDQNHQTDDIMLIG